MGGERDCLVGLCVGRSGFLLCFLFFFFFFFFLSFGGKFHSMIDRPRMLVQFLIDY